MKRLKINQHILHVLKNSNAKFRKTVLKNCDIDVIKTICEIVINTLNGNNKISDRIHKRLQKHKKILRSLSCPKKTLNTKRKIIIQKGGFLPVLLGTVLSGVIGELINSLNKN